MHRETLCCIIMKFLTECKHTDVTWPKSGCSYQARVRTGNLRVHVTYLRVWTRKFRLPSILERGISQWLVDWQGWARGQYAQGQGQWSSRSRPRPRVFVLERFSRSRTVLEDPHPCWLLDWVKVLRPTRHKMGYFRDVFSQPISWHSTEETKSNTTKSNNARTK